MTLDGGKYQETISGDRVASYRRFVAEFGGGLMEPNRSPTNVTPLPERDSPQYRTPPHNYEAEQGLLGALLVNNAAFERVGDFLKPEHFTDPVHGRIFEAIGKLIDRGHIANPVTLKAYFDQTTRSPTSAAR